MVLEGSKLWDLYALFYDVINASPPYRQLLTSVVHKLDLKPGQRLLDAGCGTGNLEALISKLNLSGIEIEAIDSNWGMLNRALKKQLPVKVRFRFGDLNQKLDYADNYFDRIAVIHTLYALQNAQFVLQEFYRVLKPGGLLVIANPHHRSSMKALMRANLEGLSMLGKIWLLLSRSPLIIINLIICRLGKSGDYHFLSEEDIRNLLEKVGFADISVDLAYADQDLLVTARKNV